MGRWTEVGRLVWQRIRKRKYIAIDDTGTDLKRCLTRSRLTFIGIANTVGVGIYVLIGVATKEYAGPSIVLSFIVAFLVTLLNALCFAEYASRTPKTGAAYTYLYQTIGEAFAFNIGWFSIIVAASSFSTSCRGFSGYLDAIFHHAIQNFTLNHIANWTSHGEPFPAYPDFPAIATVIVVMLITSIGVNISTLFTTILAGISCLLLVFITILGFFYADKNNWFNDHGGFFPYGANGVLKASSACYYAFQGYDLIAMSSEEAVNPEKTVPQSMLLTLLSVTVLYLGVSISFTLMVPYKEININAPFPGAFQYHSVLWAKYLISAGAVLTLANLCALSMYGVQRLIYSMSTDGLLFKCFSKVNQRTKVPIRPVLVLGPVGIVLILSIDLSNLISFMVMYGYIQSSFFAAYMIVLRYEPSYEAVESTEIQKSSTCPTDEGATTDNIQLERHENGVERALTMAQSTNSRSCLYSYKYFTDGFTVQHLVLIVSVACFLLSLQLVKAIQDVEEGNPLALWSLIILTMIVSLTTLVIWKREQRGQTKGFLVPLMPFLPVTTLFCNMLMLVSIAERGVVIAAVIFPIIGIALYLCMVTYGAVKTSNLSSSSQDNLLQNTYLESSDAEEL